MRGLYAITPEMLDTIRLSTEVRAAIAGGASAVQYRNKRGDDRLAHQQATAIRAITLANGVLFIVNDNIDLALSVGADGVHLGREDTDTHAIALLRARCGTRNAGGRFIIGVSCYNELTRADAAVQAGADYVAFGSFFTSRTKPNAVKADVSLIGAAKARFGVPVVAIGGITIDNAPQLISANIDAVAVISALFDADDIEQRARDFTQLFNAQNHVQQ